MASQTNPRKPATEPQRAKAEKQMKNETKPSTPKEEPPVVFQDWASI